SRDGLIDLRHEIADADVVIELLFEIGVRNARFGDTRIFDDRQRLRRAPRTNNETQRILTWHCSRAIDAGPGRIHPNAGVAQVPSESMQACGFIEPRWAAADARSAFVIVGWFGGGAHRFVARVRGTRESAHDGAGGVQDLELDFAFRSASEIVID